MKDNKRFEVVKNEMKVTTGPMILRDKLTGVHYLFYGYGSGGGLTPLLDHEGKPIIDRTTV